MFFRGCVIKLLAKSKQSCSSFGRHPLMPHYMNLTMQILSQLHAVRRIDDMIQSLFFLFFLILKQHLEFFEVCRFDEGKGEQDLWNVKTC
jgi:hypothetical protein